MSVSVISSTKTPKCPSGHYAVQARGLGNGFVTLSTHKTEQQAKAWMLHEVAQDRDRGGPIQYDHRITRL